MNMHWILLALGATASALPGEPSVGHRLPLELVGATVTPHVWAEGLRYRRERSPNLGARVQLFVRYPPAAGGAPRMLALRRILFDGRTAEQLVADGTWAWQDTPSAWLPDQRDVPPGALMVWTFNAAVWKRETSYLPALAWSTNLAPTSAGGQLPVTLESPQVWLSAVTFLSRGGSAQPDTLVFHVVNESPEPIRLTGARLALPTDNASWRFLYPRSELAFDLRGRQPPRAGLGPAKFPQDGLIVPHDSGGARVTTGPLPLTYAALEVVLEDSRGRQSSLWAHQRIKRETFDLSGGWVGNSVAGGHSLTRELFLKTLKGLHLNTAHTGLVPGYTDQRQPDGLYTRYPLKLFGAKELETFDTEAWLPWVHAVEFLGEPQYSGGRGFKTPQQVWEALAPYASGRLPTSLTLSDESTWRLYAGLSDYPHFDAYRVSAPSADAWSGYDRWGGPRIGWGAPLETIGDLCRSLREMSRPAPIAYWSQGPHHGWDVRAGRRRTSPTPDELRLQAYHALASRITSLYWFNLSLKSLVKYRDTIEELTRVGREIRMLEPLYLGGASYRYRQTRREGQLDWDLATLAAPEGALLFALDLDYYADSTNKVFTFRPPRDAVFPFELPSYLRHPIEVFRVDADGTYEVASRATEKGVEITDRQHKVAVYVAAAQRDLRTEIEKRRRDLVAYEESLAFDPAHNDEHFARLRALLEPRAE